MPHRLKNDTSWSVEDEIAEDSILKKLERKYTKPLSLTAIIEAFPEESWRMVPDQIVRLNRQLKPYHDGLTWCKKHGEYVWETIIQGWLMPKNKVDHLNNLKTMERVMCKTSRNMSEADIQRAKDVDIWNLHDFQKRGKITNCPFHEDKTASFSIRANKFCCFGCGVKGDSIDFIKLKYNMTFYQAVEYLLKI